MEETFTNDIYIHRLEDTGVVVELSRLGNAWILSLSLAKSPANLLLTQISCITVKNNIIIDSTDIHINYDCTCVENREGYLVHRGIGGLS